MLLKGIVLNEGQLKNLMKVEVRSPFVGFITLVTIVESTQMANPEVLMEFTDL